MRKTHWITLLLAAACGPGAAQQVWRCGNSYSTQPCAGGSSFEAVPAPSKAEAARAEKAALLDAKRADVDADLAHAGDAA